MKPLVEMLLQSLEGDGFSQIKQKFDLDSEDAEKAIEAVLPAFSTGLKRNTAKPKNLGAFLQTLSDGRHAKYIDDTNTAFTDEGIRDGNGILKHLFGSKKASRALSNQASSASGVDENTIKKMLPVIASMVMGGVFKQSTGQTEPETRTNLNSSNASQISGGGILGDILGELVKNGMGENKNNQSSKGSKKRRKNENPLGDLLEQMMGGSKRKSKSKNKRSYSDDSQMGQIFEDMLSGKRGRYQPVEDIPKKTRRKKTKPVYDDTNDGFEDIGSADQYERNRSDDEYSRQNSPHKEKGGLEDLFGDMFETGRDVDDGYQEGVESIFDKFMKR
jgi:hypothetical protein